jgi:hypothetical protein
MSDQVEPSGGHRQRGIGFPSLPLDEAARVVKSAGKYGRSHSDAGFAGYLGHNTTNSGPFRSKMASLRDWGLIERPTDGQVPLTDLGHHLAHPSSTEDETSLLREAFFNATPFAGIYNESAKETDLSLEFIGNRAVTALGVSAQGKQRFADSFARSVVAAGLGRRDTKGMIQLIPSGVEPESLITADQARVETTPATVTASEPSGYERSVGRQPPRSHISGDPPTLHQEWKVSGGRVLFEVELDRPLPGTAFATVAKIIMAMEEFVHSLGPATCNGSDKAVDNDDEET